MPDNKSFDKEWYPHHILSGEVPVALLILNQPLGEDNVKYLKRNWESAAFRVAVDGGANQLKLITNDNFKPVPDLLCGDFDSVSSNVLEFYREKGVNVVHTPCQDETDFTKALRLTAQKIKEKYTEDINSFVALCRNGDRLDHILGNIHTLYLAKSLHSAPVFILGHTSLTWLLLEGSHRIHVTEKMMNSHVGIIPMGKDCTDVTTTGLKWNLNHDKMSFTGLISTCNLFEEKVVTVTTDSPLIWTMEISMNMV